VVDADKIAHLRGLEAYLRARIRGQDHLLLLVTKALLRSEMGLSPAGRPRASLLFVGPTGTGKTELALACSEFLFGPGQTFRFDLSEYQNQSSVERLLGADRNDPGLLGRVLAQHNRGTLLFDELEKAHPLVLDLFLQILDAARVTVATGETHSLDRFVVIFTSNLGSAEAMRMERSKFATVEAATLRRLEQSLRPELLARLDERLVFARLSPATQREICVHLVESELCRLRALGHDLTAGPEVIELLVKRGYDRELGARPMRRTVEKSIQQAVVNELFRSGTVLGRLYVVGDRQDITMASATFR
jgi:ATP-dependent Clp protease ATP-binding subunit ClpA